MANIAIFRINYKSDFILTLNSDAGWMTPFCIKFWTGAPSQAYFAGYDGETYTHCAPVAGDPTKLEVQFDDHHLPIGDLKFQIGYHFTVADFPTTVEDEVINQAAVIIDQDGTPMQVMLDLNGETAPEIQFSLPAYANEAQRIANEEQRIAAEAIRIVNEESRIAAETIRQQNEAQRIAQETARVNEFATLKAQSQAATSAANTAAALANEKAQLAADKAALADAAATLANDKAALAQQKAEYAQQQGGYAKDQGDYAKNQGDYAKEQVEIAQADHERAEADHGIAVDDHTQAGNDHTRAESDHGIAVDDHTQAGNDHTRAESDHGIAVDDHTQADNDHTRAESDHGIAVDDHTQAGNDHTRAESDHTRAESDHAAVEVYVDSLGAFDISAYHATGGVLAKYADLTAALGTNGANIPDTLRKGGMSVKFVQSSDNKYVQYRLMHTLEDASTAAADFANTANWQGVDDEPITGSENFVKSGGIKTEFDKKLDKKQNADTFLITDSNGYAVAKIDSEGIHAVNVSIKDGDSEKTLTNIIQTLNNAIASEGSRVEKLVSAEQTRAEGVEATKFDKSLNSESLDVTDNNGYIVARIDNNGLSSVDVKVKDSTTGQLVSLKTLIENEKTRAITEENKKLDHTIEDNKFFITDSNGYKIFQIDTSGAHAPNLFEGTYNDNKILIMDNNGYIVAKIDANGIHSAKDKHAVACMVLSESYYPTTAPTRDSNGNVTYADVMFETGVAGSLSITYTNGNSSSVAVVYGSYNYTITINRDAKGNVETVSVN